MINVILIHIIDEIGVINVMILIWETPDVNWSKMLVHGIQQMTN